jgi:putative colanic acid biosynthesis UDP-glucose lipid carrier transferase
VSVFEERTGPWEDAPEIGTLRQADHDGAPSIAAGRAGARSMMQAGSYPLHDSLLFKGGLSIAILALGWVSLPSVLCCMDFYLCLRFFREPLQSHYTVLLVVAVSLCTLIMQPGRSLAKQLMHARVSLAVQILMRWAVLLFVLLLIGFVTRSTLQFPRRVLMTWGASTPILIICATCAVQSWLRQLTQSANHQRRVLIVGCNETSLRLAKHIRSNPALCMRITGFFDDRSLDRLGEPDVSLLGNLASLADYVRRSAVDTIFVALPIQDVQRVTNLIESLRDTTASVYYVPDLFAYDLIQAKTGDVGGIPVVAICETPMHGLPRVSKRIFDVVVASLLTVACLPLVAAIGILIKISSPGPIILRSDDMVSTVGRSRSINSGQ